MNLIIEFWWATIQLDWNALQEHVRHHRRWFESADRYAPSYEHVAIFRELMPENWRLHRNSYWFGATTPDVTTPKQGWKLHVSATSRTSEAVLREALPVLRDCEVQFKFVVDPKTMRDMNSKTFPREASGKFITIYPSDDERFRILAGRLTSALAGFDGPYILSDRRCPGSRVVYYRYGGFLRRARLRPDGTSELVVLRPDGTEVPDIRRPYWDAPDWVADPFTTREQPGEARAGTSGERTSEPAGLIAGRYLVESAIQFSNRGGVYRGIDTETGADVVVREARPGVEVGPDGTDATTVLRHEHSILTELADTGLFVRPIQLVTQWEHLFLVEEYVNGPHLGRLGISENPLYGLDLSPARLSAYYQRMRGLWLQVFDAIRECHSRGIVLGDLSFDNVVVGPGDRVRIIDLESAFHEGTGGGAGLVTPGMVAPATAAGGRADRSNDYYALGGLMLGAVHVCQNADSIDRGVPRRLLAGLAADLALPDDLVSLIEDLRADGGPPEPGVTRSRIEALDFTAAWRRAPALAERVRPDEAACERTHKRVTAAVHDIVEQLTAVADPHRSDRLFPADFMVFPTNPLSLAHGAYGCLYALEAVGASVPDALLAWALRHATGPDVLPPGLYSGSGGVAWAQHALGYPEVAVRTLRSAAGHPVLHTEPGVLTGAAGHGMACLRLWQRTGLTEFLDRARDIGEHLAGTATFGSLRGGQYPHWTVSGGTTPVGYGHGAAGIAMFLLALHAATGEDRTLDLGRGALDFDLAQAELTPFGRFAFPSQISEDGRPSPVLRQYWDYGTAGVLTTLLRYHHVTGDSGLRTRIDDLLPDVRRKYVTFPQLFHGAAGIGMVLLDAYEHLGDPTLLGDAHRVADAVLDHMVERPGEGSALPGEQMLRESCDLATGSAGIVLFLDRIHRCRPGSRTNPNFLLDTLLAGGGAGR